MDNYDIAEKFSLLAKLIDIHGDDSFKSKNYANAAYNLERVEGNVAEMDLGDISALRGVGKSSAAKIIQLIETGTFDALEEYMQKTPAGIFELMKIKGIGPKKINTIYKQLEIETPGELLYACNENRLTLYKGFGAKTQQNIIEALGFYFSNTGQYLFAQVDVLLPAINERLENAECEFFATSDFATQDNIIKNLAWAVDAEIEDLNSIAEEEEEIIINEDGSYTLQTKEGPDFNFYLSSQPIKTAFEKSCSEDFLNSIIAKYGAIPNAENEEEIFDKLGLPFIPSYHRYTEDAIEYYKAGKQETCIGLKDIKGMIHNHSTYSDGVHSLEKMLLACVEKGYEYLVISDHSQAASYAGGLQPYRIKEQHAEINLLNEKYPNFKIFKSIECDILIDGALDYNDEILASFDMVIASVHSGLRMTEEKAMQRLLKAVSNPFTTMLGHCTGRLLLSRPGYPIAYDALFEACAKNNVTIELNAHPRRLDMDYTLIPKALSYGLNISINPDAHEVDGFDNVYYGSVSARKGFLPKAKNISSMGLADFETWLGSLK
jgi:DNA polymerase (family X)